MKRARQERRWIPLSAIGLVWAAVFAVSLSGPPLLDDADATHAQAARAMLTSGDWVTLHVNGIRYLEKAPLPYWLVAVSLRMFAPHTDDLAARGAFAVHLPTALAVLGLALLGYAWAWRAFAERRWCPRAALYTALFLLTAPGVFLFTRVFLPDALLSLLLAAALYCAVVALDSTERLATWAAYGFWVMLALAVLTKGLVALVLVPAAFVVSAAMGGDIAGLRRLRPATGVLLFLALAAPWHVLAGLRNTGGAEGHGFFWFYFVNEHALRFLGRRIPRDYNKVPAALYWLQHLLWLFPWSFFLVNVRGVFPRGWLRAGTIEAGTIEAGTTEARTLRLLVSFTAVTLVFFSLSTNQEYYTLPVYLPVLLLAAAGLARAEFAVSRMVLPAHGAITVVCGAAAVVLGWGLWTSRAVSGGDLAGLMAHRAMGEYTLATSHLFDLTTAALAGLRLPAVLAMVALAVAPPVAWWLRARRSHAAATLTLAAMSTVFLVAAQMAFVRFSPMLSSADFAAEIRALEAERRIAPGSDVLLFGDQAEGSSLPFYLGRQVLLVDGRSTSMLFGSSFGDAPKIFLTSEQLRSQWGSGRRRLLFVPADRREQALRGLGANAVVLADSAGKLLLTDRPLERPGP